MIASRCGCAQWRKGLFVSLPTSERANAQLFLASVPLLSAEGIKNLHASPLENAGIACGEGQAVRQEPWRQ